MKCLNNFPKKLCFYVVKKNRMKYIQLFKAKNY